MLHLVVTSVHCLSFQVEQRDFFGLFFSLCTGPIHDRQPLTLRRDNKLIIWRMPCSQGAAPRLFRRRRFSPQNLVFPFAHQMKSIHLHVRPCFHTLTACHTSRFRPILTMVHLLLFVCCLHPFISIHTVRVFIICGEKM